MFYQMSPGPMICRGEIERGCNGFLSDATGSFDSRAKEFEFFQFAASPSLPTAFAPSDKKKRRLCLLGKVRR